jgi:hypothetical protein
LIEKNKNDVSHINNSSDSEKDIIFFEELLATTKITKRNCDVKKLEKIKKKKEMSKTKSKLRNVKVI